MARQAHRIADTRDDLGERLENCYSGVVFDALREHGITDTVLPHSLRPLDPAKTLAGPIFTASGSPKRGLNAHETLLRWTEFLSTTPKDHVVICAGQDADRALMGELSAETLQYRGVKGYVTDGGCRDCAFIIDIGFPVFACFHTPRDIVGAWTPDNFQQSLEFLGVPVSPGDYLIADIDGAVIIPAAIAAEIVADAEAAMQSENLVRRAILEGMAPKDAYLKFGKF